MHAYACGSNLNRWVEIIYRTLHLLRDDLGARFFYLFKEELELRNDK